MDPTLTKLSPVFVPSPEEVACRTRVYKNVREMSELKNKSMPHFATGPDGERSFLDYVDMSEKILNGFTMSREASGKEEWRSNLCDNITLAKMRAIAAGVGLKTPEMSFTAVNKNGMRSSVRADIFKNIVKTSYDNENPTLNTFNEVWHMMGHGVTFEYEGYKTGGCMQEVIDSFDSVTGKVNTHMEYRKMNGKPFSVLIGPQEFFWWTFKVRDIQDQPRLAWIQHFTKRELEMEFSKYPNYKYVKDKAEASKFSTLNESTYFTSEWQNRVGENDDYEVIRYYSKADEGQEGKYGYEVWTNGVPLLQSPLLWGDKEKKYPFAKQIANPFANTNFFVGMSFPGILEAYQDGKNAVLNTLIDKMYRAVDPLKLVGLQNRDLFDIETEVVSHDNTIYVPDINAVKFLEHPSINAGELQMLAILDRGIESESIDKSQQGISSATQKTATQIQTEDARAREIKGSLFMFLEDLWLQKTRLRTEVILSHFLKDKAAQDTIKDKIITIKDYSFGDGSRGTLDIYVAKSKKDRLTQQDIEAREQAMEKQGIAYKLISMDVDFLNEWEYDFKIQPKSFEKGDAKVAEDDLMAEIQQLTTLFPEFFVANKDKYLRELLLIHGKHQDEFAPPAPMPAEKPKLIETLSYKDAPPDIRRQIETQAGLKPSTATEASPLAPQPKPEKKASVLGLK
jgi:hypothetical protein